MSISARNRLIGGVLLLTIIAGMPFIPDTSSLADKVVWFLAGGGLGLGGGLLVTGRAFWTDTSWWASPNQAR